MRVVDWVPVSASALVAGVTALALAAILLPAASENSAESLMLARQDDGRWIAVSALFFFASVALMLGLPCILTLFTHRGSWAGTAGLVVFAAGCIGMAGYAMLLAFFRALALSPGVENQTFVDVTGDRGLSLFLYGWVGAFYLGVLLIALALLPDRATPVWVSALLLAQVAVLPALTSLPHVLQSASALMMAVGFAGIAISANNADLAR